MIHCKACAELKVIKIYLQVCSYSKIHHHMFLPASYLYHLNMTRERPCMVRHPQEWSFLSSPETSENPVVTAFMYQAPALCQVYCT